MKAVLRLLIGLCLLLLCATPTLGQTDRLRPIAYNELYGAKDEGRRRLDVYAPDDVEPPWPVLMVFHGYGGDKSDAGGLMLPEIAARAGYATVSVNYSLLMPDGYLDAYCALAWVQTAGGEEFNLDPARVVTLGISWGGLPATMLAVQERPDVFPLNCPYPTPDPDAVRGAVSVAGVLAGSAEGLAGYVSEGPLLEDAVRVALEAAPPEDWLTLDLPLEVMVELSLWPMVWIDDHEPPHLLIHGVGDSSIPYWQSYDYAQILSRNRTSVTLVMDRLAGHVPGPAVFENDLLAFLERTATG